MLLKTLEPEAHDKVVDNPDKIGFWGEGENRSTRKKNSQCNDKSQQQTQPTWRHIQESNTGHIGGRQVLLPLLHPCSPYI